MGGSGGLWSSLVLERIMLRVALLEARQNMVWHSVEAQVGSHLQLSAFRPVAASQIFL